MCKADSRMDGFRTLPYEDIDPRDQQRWEEFRPYLDCLASAFSTSKSISLACTYIHTELNMSELN